MVLAADAMRGHMSAHSFATGPVIADPFISPFGLTITPALSVSTPNSKQETTTRDISCKGGVAASDYHPLPACPLSLEQAKSVVDVWSYLSCAGEGVKNVPSK